MSCSDKKTIVVVGATGNQGSSVAKTFLSLPKWRVRCVTRNPSSAASEALAALGAEMVQADLSDVSSLSRAFEGANAIFVNTDFWASYRAANAAAQGEATKPSSELVFDEEVMHGKNAAIAAARVPTLERFVYSALPPTKRHSKGKYSQSYHSDSKATVVDYIENEQPGLAKKTSYIYLGGYTTNAMLTPTLDPSSEKYTFVLPIKKETMIPIIDPKESTGTFVRALIEDEDAGTKLLAYDSQLSIAELADLWSKVSGKEVAFVEVSLDTMHRKFGIPMERLDSLGFLDEFGYTGGIEGIIEPSHLKTKVQTKSFEEWLKANLDLSKIGTKSTSK